MRSGAEAARCPLPGFSEVSAKVLNSTKHADSKTMSTFEADEHLQGRRPTAQNSADLLSCRHVSALFKPLGVAKRVLNL